ncbi:hypothetical protein GTQ99_13220 [Kineococcus sp. T13]|uniref:hypothetical protein n=1 Tax=Kineococcus vitellinus TaxID=2696565 RepID=UPI001411D090|nr:hypothetical protein [Kineococcus vitellinus]NAZ76367.1 hypothetical protein [Kineococcus vitellinus]
MHSDIDTSARAVGEVLTDEVYVLLPDDGERHFLGEAVLVGIAGSLLAAFLKGLTAAAEDRVEQWGKDVGAWIVRRVEDVVRSEQPDVVGTEKVLPDAVTEARSAFRRAGDAQEVERLLATALVDEGMAASEAARIASRVGEQARGLLAEDRDSSAVQP